MNSDLYFIQNQLKFKMQSSQTDIPTDFMNVTEISSIEEFFKVTKPHRAKLLYSSQEQAESIITVA